MDRFPAEEICIFDPRLFLSDIKVLQYFYVNGGESGCIARTEDVQNNCGLSNGGAYDSVTKLIELGWLDATRINGKKYSYKIKNIDVIECAIQRRIEAIEAELQLLKIASDINSKRRRSKEDRTTWIVIKKTLLDLRSRMRLGKSLVPTSGRLL